MSTASHSSNPGRRGRRRDRLKRRVAHALRTIVRRLGGRPNRSADALARQRTRREVAALAGPIAAAMAGEVVLGLVDTKLVSALGASALGGVGLAGTVLFLWYAIVFGVLRGVKVRAAFAVGEGRPEDATRYALVGVVLGAVLGTGALVIGRNPGPLLALLGASPELRPAAETFLQAITWGAPATCAVNALIQHRQAIGDARTPMIVGLSGNVFNGVVGYGLIYGHFGLPALGVAGGGYATALTEHLELVWLGLLLARDVRRESRSSLLSTRAALREITSLGVPTGVHFGAELLAFTTFTVILGTLGPHEIAAHQIALATLRASFLPGAAVAEAASILVGRSLGRRSLAEADRVTSAALLLAMTFMAACGVVFALLGGPLARFFTDEESVVAITTRLLLVASVFQLLDAANMVLRGALRGAKDVRFVAVVGITVVWLSIPGAAWLLGRHAGLGALGGWLGFVAETTLGAAILFVRYRRGAWRRAYETRDEAEEAPILATASA